MSRSAAVYLHDMLQAARGIRRFSDRRTYDDYVSGLMFRSAVEPQFEIIGDALNQLGKLDPATQARVRNFRNIVRFRNILITATRN